jgi:glycosyltransferase involved in cell wall biosynthesis
MTTGRALAGMGDNENPTTWSGIPYFLMEAGRRQNFLDGGLDLRVANFRSMRCWWQAGQFLRGAKPRGFQYSRRFLEELGNKAVAECQRADLREIVSHYQLLPAASCLAPRSIRTSFYIDTTLHALFTTQRMWAWLDGRTAADAVRREREEYHSALHVVTMARWVRDSLREVYGLSPERIHTVLAGANLPEDLVQLRLSNRGQRRSPERFTGRRPFRIGFTGKDWQRKGLPRLVGAVEILNRMGVPSEVAVIGKLPAHLSTHRYVRWMGLIDKARDVGRFLEILESCDVGCAPSYEEPMGIAPLEYLRLGIPVVCTLVEGLIDVCEAAGGASVAVHGEATAEELAVQLEAVARDANRRAEMQDTAWNRKEHFTWDRAVRELRGIWETSGVGGAESASRPGFPHFAANSQVTEG